MSLLLYEALDGPLDIGNIDACMNTREPIVVTDCKSLYDHVKANTSPSSLEDKRCAIDVVVIKDSVQRCGASFRWCPTNRQLADALTKDKGDPADLLRACMRAHRYQLADEEYVLELKANERENRRLRGAQRKEQSTRTPGGPKMIVSTSPRELE
eukprot:9490458-Pyramimonas_sp.AAC.1